MISLSRLYCRTPEPGDAVRYAQPSAADGTAPPPAVVVWNATARCRLACRHCYAAAASASDPSGADELSTDEARALIDRLAAFGVRVLLFSGGEPLERDDIVPLTAHAHAAGLRPVLSTSGLGLTPALSERLRDAGLGYVGVSLDGTAPTHNRLRGDDAAFARALAGVRAARDAGLRTGVRFTLLSGNAADLDAVLDLVEGEGVPRLCVYHLAYSGRGAGLRDADLPPGQARAVLDHLLDRTRALHDRGRPVEVLTVGNHSDGVALLLRILREDPARAAGALALLRQAGGNAAGERIACVSWDGTVYPDQFWRTRPLGNVRQTPLGRIWSDDPPPLLRALRERERRVTGRCAACAWFDLCRGNLRARAEAATGDPWAADPACILTDSEIAQRPAAVAGGDAPDG